MAAFDSTTSAMLSHVQDIETRRRSTMLKLKEVEAKTVYLSEECTTLKESAQQLKFRENAAKMQLQQLCDHQEDLSNRLQYGMQSLVRAQAEEPHLHKQAVQLREVAEANVCHWKAATENVSKMSRLWEGTGSASTIGGQISQAEQKLAEMQSTEHALKEELRVLQFTLSTEEEDARSVQEQRNSENTAAAFAPKRKGATDALLRQLQSNLISHRNNLTHLEIQSGHTMQGLEREVSDLTKRHLELKQWSDDTAASRVNTLRAIEELATSLKSGICQKCRSDNNQQE